MKKYVVKHKCGNLIVEASENNTCIVNSYRVKNRKDMKNILLEVRRKAQNEPTFAIHHRTIASMIREWRVHNLLYYLDIERDRTRSVDLDIAQPWYIRTAYFILSPFYALLP